MKKNRTLLIVALIFILLLGGAYVLYGELSRDAAPDQLSVQNAPAGQAADTAQDSGGGTEDTQPPEDAAGAEGEPEKMPAPDFTAYDADGNPMQLSAYVGKPVVLNFWASWCGPCQIEMPDFQEAYTELGEDIHFLMVNMTDGARETVEIASDFIAEKGYSFPVFYDTDSDAAIAYSVYSLPTTYFIDAEGYLVAQATGAINRETLQKGIDMVLPS